MNPILTVRGLRYRYPDGTQALDGVDFQLGHGESVAVLGPNGSGKTTFVLLLMDLLKGEGSVEVQGKPGLVFQDPDEQLFMPSVLEDVAFGPLNQGLTVEAAQARARQVLDRVGMTHALAKAPYHLSAGEKRRAAIAGVLAMEPDILILDEPTTFLDPPAQRDLAGLLRDLPQAKLLITHDMGFARTLAQRAIFFQHGNIVGDGALDEIIQRYSWDSREST